MKDVLAVDYHNIPIYFTMDGYMSGWEKEEPVTMAQKYSPVFNTITKLVPVTVQIDKV
jgi:hypothetical protein